MKSVKIKVALLANLVAVLCLIILGITTFIFVKDAISTEVVNAQTHFVETAKNSMESFKARNSAAVESFAKNILKHPLGNLDHQEALERFVGRDLKTFRDSGRFLAVYIAQPNGELVVSDPDSDAKNLDFGIYGKADDYDARTREYYQEALKTKDIYITPSYIDVTTKQPCFTYAIALHKDGKFIGVLAVDVLVADLQQEFENLPGRVFAFDQNHQIFVAKDREMLDPKFDITAVATIAKERAGYEVFTYTRAEDGNERFGICTQFTKNYTICIGENMSEINAPVYKIALIQAMIVIFVSFISIILLYFIVSRFLSPLSLILSGLNSFFDFL
ncbi:cache domain-containing protein, partial [Campylobacter sp.]|uniref:cache domain-containing protein n=1 Tax=Campylobacter sp. TaxID=205 RepID=UPI0026DB0B47